MSGDHASVMIPKGVEVQTALRTFKDDHIVDSEIQWLDKYLQGEYENNEDLVKDGVLVDHKYTLYDVALQSYKTSTRQKNGNYHVEGFVEYLANAITAKGNVGISTNDTWIFAMILELYMKYYVQFNGKYLTTGTSKERSMVRISQKDCDEISSIYVTALQDFVVRGIKHTDGGSASFQVLFLKELSKAENQKTITALLTDKGVSNTLISRMINIAVWAQEIGFISACGSFLKLYNKGTMPAEGDVKDCFDMHEEYIQKNTYFGKLLQPIYDLRQRVYRHKESKQKEIETLKASISDADIDDILGL